MSTEVFEGMPDAEAVDTATLTEVDGRTTMRILVEHSCQEHPRPAHQLGHGAGMQEAMDHLEQLAASLAA